MKGKRPVMYVAFILHSCSHAGNSPLQHSVDVCPHIPAYIPARGLAEDVNPEAGVTTQKKQVDFKILLKGGQMSSAKLIRIAACIYSGTSK